MGYKEDLKRVLKQLEETKFTYAVDDDPAYIRRRKAGKEQTAARQDGATADDRARAAGADTSYGRAMRAYLERQRGEADSALRQQYGQQAKKAYDARVTGLEKERDGLKDKVLKEEQKAAAERAAAQERARKEAQRQEELRIKEENKLEIERIRAQAKVEAARLAASKKSGRSSSGGAGSAKKSAGASAAKKGSGAGQKAPAAFDETSGKFRSLAAESHKQYLLGYSRGKESGGEERGRSFGYQQQVRWLYAQVDGDPQKTRALANYLKIPTAYTSEEALGRLY